MSSPHQLPTEDPQDNDEDQELADSPTEASPIVTIDSVAVQLGDVTALDGVSSIVERGDFLGLIGPNGAGKTTLLRTITAAITPDEGSVQVNGEAVHSLPSRAVSRKVAVVPQDTSLSFDFNVREIVAMGRTPYISRFSGGERADRNAVEEAMMRTEVMDFADRSVSEVSGGERQRVLLARALAQDTPLLLLDEPTASLDINHQIRTLELVRELVRDGKTVIAAIHDLNLAARYCDELLLLEEGKKMARGEPGEVLTTEHLKGAFDSRAMVTRHPITGAVRVTALSDDYGQGAGGHVHVIGGGGRTTRLLYELCAAGYEVSIGAVQEGAASHETAQLLGLEMIEVPPFAVVDESVKPKLSQIVRTADVTVLVDVELHPGNLPNIEVAHASDTLIIAEDRPLSDRNHAGERGHEIYTSLREVAKTVATNNVYNAIQDRLDPEEETAMADPTEISPDQRDGPYETERR